MDVLAAALSFPRADVLSAGCMADGSQPAAAARRSAVSDFSASAFSASGPVSLKESIQGAHPPGYRKRCPQAPKEYKESAFQPVEEGEQTLAGMGDEGSFKFRDEQLIASKDEEECELLERPPLEAVAQRDATAAAGRGKSDHADAADTAAVAVDLPAAESAGAGSDGDYEVPQLPAAQDAGVYVAEAGMVGSEVSVALGSSMLDYGGRRAGPAYTSTSAHSRVATPPQKPSDYSSGDYSSDNSYAVEDSQETGLGMGSVAKASWRRSLLQVPCDWAVTQKVTFKLPATRDIEVFRYACEHSSTSHCGKKKLHKV